MASTSDKSSQSLTPHVIGGVCARVAAESFKFARLYPLNQRDLPEHITNPERHSKKDRPEPLLDVSPACDFTPSTYITLLFTDLGVLTPAAVSDELIRLYQ